jgi:hypothetical protein
LPLDSLAIFTVSKKDKDSEFADILTTLKLYFSLYFKVKCPEISPSNTTVNEHLFQSNSDESTYDKYNIFSEKPEAGKLLIFPSKLSHNVEPNMSDTRRYSISFNAYPEIHDKQHTTYLNIKVLPYDRNRVDIEE